MKNWTRFSRRASLMVGLLACAPTLVAAQEDGYAPIVLQLPATPRAAVLGNVVGARDIEAIFGNPAMIGVAAGTVAGFARYDAATLLSLASGSSLGPFSVGIGAQYLDATAFSDRLPLSSYSLCRKDTCRSRAPSVPWGFRRASGARATARR